jgi:precorrin-2 dehydrogenase/sirohydrochlorin ferrochelatase
MIPLFVDCAGKRIVIFGGGDVASRKAAFFSGEAEVLVVSR